MKWWDGEAVAAADTGGGEGCRGSEADPVRGEPFVEGEEVVSGLLMPFLFILKCVAEASGFRGLFMAVGDGDLECRVGGSAFILGCSLSLFSGGEFLGSASVGATAAPVGGELSLVLTNSSGRFLLELKAAGSPVFNGSGAVLELCRPVGVWGREGGKLSEGALVEEGAGAREGGMELPAFSLLIRESDCERMAVLLERVAGRVDKGSLLGAGGKRVSDRPGSLARGGVGTGRLGSGAEAE